MLGTFFAEIDNSFGFYAQTDDVADDALSKSWVFNLVADTQTQILAVGGLWWNVFLSYELNIWKRFICKRFLKGAVLKGSDSRPCSRKSITTFVFG